MLSTSGQFFGLKQRDHQVDMTWIAVRCAEGKGRVAREVHTHAVTHASMT